jgi:hypothetical protein
MRRSHRTVHRALWPILAVTVAALFVSALLLRPPPEPDEAQAASETVR